MFQRSLQSVIQKEIGQYPVQAITGPRQSGKTTLARYLFPDYQYVLLEETDLRNQAKSDPRGFFARFAGNLILDEVQKVPELLSYIQGIVDDQDNQRRFVLTGSEHLLLSEKISQTLAGRVRVYHLLPCERKELPESKRSLDETLFWGGYPKIFDKDLDPTVWLGQYYATYVQKDVREIINVGDLDKFDRFVRLVAARVGQLLDYSGVANDCGISPPTASKWLGLLKSTFIVFTLEPHFRNFNKRLIKSPKVYFYDSGLLCYLLRMREANHLATHPLRGQVFENWVIAEELKRINHQGQESNLYFWRDQKGHEVDLIQDRGLVLYPIEIKSAQTFDESFLSGLKYFNGLQKYDEGVCIYGGDGSFPFKRYQILSWRDHCKQD